MLIKFWWNNTTTRRGCSHSGWARIFAALSFIRKARVISGRKSAANIATGNASRVGVFCVKQDAAEIIEIMQKARLDFCLVLHGDQGYCLREGNRPKYYSGALAGKIWIKLARILVDAVPLRHIANIFAGFRQGVRRLRKGRRIWLLAGRP